jgi:glycosyltransferase involved in cell wall biosynthesis
MRVGILFHKNPYGPAIGIDLVRIRAIAGGLRSKGIDAEIISPVLTEGTVDGDVPVRHVSVLDSPGGYDLIKTSYHDSITLLGNYQGPVVSRIVRVVDEHLPKRDDSSREKLLQCQEMINSRSSAVVLNNRENRARWREMYGGRLPVHLIPTGCPAVLPQPKGNPLSSGPPAMLFLGSLAAPRMIRILNEAAQRLNGLARIHFIGRNKAYLYGGGNDCRLDPLIADHGELAEEHVWGYIRNSQVGLALATGPYAFDNDVSKILNYLRGGLPVLSEEPIINNELIRETRFGKIFKHGDIEDFVVKATQLLSDLPVERREAVMRFMATEHSWDRRVDSYISLFEQVLKGRGNHGDN